MSTADLDRLAASWCISLTTYKRDGTAVPAPVWVVRDGSHLLVWTGGRTGKAKRLRHTARVTVARCDARGRLLGDPMPGTARLLPADELPRVERLVARKYRIAFPAVRLVNRIVRLARRGPPTGPRVGVEITLA